MAQSKRGASSKLSELNSSAELRKRAEEMLSKLDPKNEKMTQLQTEKLLHELQVHQIELELQNNELRRTQLALDESLEKFSDLYNLAPVGYLTLNKNGIIEQANSTAHSLVGVGMNQMVNKPFSHFIINEDQDTYYFAHRKLIDTEKNQQFDIRLKKKAKSFFWAHVVSNMYKKDEESFTNFITFSDISERKKAEYGLSKSEQKYQALVDQSPIAYEVYDKNGLQLKVNAAYENIMGMKAEDSVGIFNVRTDPQVEILGIKPFVERAFVGEVVDLPEFQWDPRKSGFPGRARWLKTILYPIKNEHGDVSFVVINHSDVTEHINSKKNLDKQQFYLTKAQEIGSIGTWEIDLKKDILEWTDESYRIFGVEIGTPMNYESFLELIHPDDVDSLNKEWMAAVEGKPYDIEHRILVNGKIKWVREKADLIFDDDGNVIRAIGVAQDITERKRAEKKLSVQEEDLKESQRIAHVGSWRLDISTNEVTWSEELYKMFGLDPSLPPPAFNKQQKFYTPESWNRMNNAVAKTVETEITYDVELEIVRKDGSNGWIWSLGEVVLDEKGKSVGLRGAAQDITERKQDEEAIKLNESRLNILVGILHHESDTIQEILDHALSEIIKLTDSKIGYIYYYSEEKNEFTLNSWSKGVMNECTILEKQTVYQLDKTGLWGEAVRQRKPIMVNDFQAENQFKKGYPTGHATLHKFLTVPVFTNNKIVGVVALVNKETDYTETDILHVSLIMNFVWKVVDRKNVEIALRNSEEKLSTLFGSMTEMVVLHELVFNEKGEAVNYRITDCNNAFTKVTGIKKENAVGKLATEVYQTEVAPYFDIYSNVAITGKPNEYTSYFAPMDKHFSISVVSPQQNQFATITTDITALQQIQKVISDKNKELENFLYVSSHDLRTPLVNIQGFSNRLQKQIGSIKTLIDECSLEPEAEAKIGSVIEESIPKTLDFIFTNVSKMDVLINALLEISRTGRVKMTIKKIDINQLIEKVVSSLNFQITELSVKVITKEMVDCYGDESLLNRLFTNIIVNAIKYRNRERPLVLEISSEAIYNKVIYSIKDNGMGIGPRHLEKIWNVFYRVDSASPEAGDGIGLSISKTIVDKHKGKIWAESEEGKGSVFSIELLTEEFSE